LASYYKIVLPTGQNDYLCRTMLDGKLCVLHMSYNSTGDFWTVGFCDDEGTPIVDGIRIVPNFPLNIWYMSYDVPQGALFAMCSEGTITRYSFDNGTASLCYLPIGEIES
jgi:hypothetical protein